MKSVLSIRRSQISISGPKTVLKEHDLETPEGMQAKVSENAYDCVHITMPMPPQGHLELADEELIEAAGGSTIVTPKRNDTYSICTPGMMQQRSA